MLTLLVSIVVSIVFQCSRTVTQKPAFWTPFEDCLYGRHPQYSLHYFYLSTSGRGTVPATPSSLSS